MQRCFLNRVTVIWSQMLYFPFFKNFVSFIILLLLNKINDNFNENQ